MEARTDPVGELPETLPALTEVQQFWRQLRWLAPPLILGAVLVVRPQIPHVPSWAVIVVSVVLALVPAAVNLLSGRETGLRLEEIPSRRQTVELLVDAAVILVLVAVFCLAAPHSDTFALLLLPQLQMATTRRLPLMIATATVSGLAFVGIELVAASLHGLATPWPSIGGRMALLLLGAAILGRISLLMARHLRALRELHRDVAYRALHDPLTGLPNRAVLFERIGLAMARQERSGARFAVVFVDLDDLKTVNDTLGHAAGDELLRSTARRLRDELRTTDTPARVGGDEFAALLDDPGSDDDLENLTRRLLDRLGRPISGSSLDVRPSVSIGVATSERMSSADELIGRADAAMYQAKAEGKGRVAHFDVDDPADPPRPG